jgi:hypothetical protein
MSIWLANAIGLAVSVIGGAVALGLNSVVFARQPPKREAVLAGLVERTIYFLGAYAGSYEVIAAWLVLKAALEFKATDRHDHHWYQLGVGMSLLFGIGGALLAKSLAA